MLTVLPVLTNVIDTLESLQLLEGIYGYLTGKGFRVVGIANELSNEQRDAILEINWAFQSRHAQLDIEITLIRRHGRLISDLFYDDGSAIVRRNITSV
jgi:hypothetical protein